MKALDVTEGQLLIADESFLLEHADSEINNSIFFDDIV